ncbi:restriction endonuclease subunit S [Pseudomonas psychrophila]|uniref:restriction endonuclease subunit S n=1 Tax=Pseudomonas psychrophila TaxID=122355 RepID=UPI0003571835|nr:restriction endonuclease subunit S [Pseudomonas psychrophila]EPJ95150.1 type I restriction-modification system, S subunit [Pseudomonas psychrophila]
MTLINLPEEWSACTIADVAFVNPKKIEADPDLIAGFVPMSHAPIDFTKRLHFEEKTWSEIQRSYTNFQDGDVIFAKVTPCFENGKAAIVTGLPNGIGAGSTEFYVLRPYNHAIVDKLLFALIKTQSFSQNGAENMTGAVGLRRVPRKFVEDFKFFLPPIAEQKVIADKLDALLSQVETAKACLDRIPDILKRFRQSVLAAAVSGKLTEVWRKNKGTVANSIELYEKSVNSHGLYFGKKYKKPEKVDLRNLKLIPDNWTWGIISHLVNPGDEIVYGIVQPGEKLAEGIPYVRGTDIQDGRILVNQLLKTSPEIAQKYDRASLKENDILLGIIRATKVAIVPKILNGANITQGTARIRVNIDVLHYRYLYFYLESQDVQAWLHSNYRGIDMPGLNLKDVRRLPVALPPMEEQTEIVHRIEERFAFADSIEQKAKAALERVNNLTQSILAKAFRGELTVDWRAANPDLISGENSAEALLEKIKAEREAIKPTKKARARKQA